MARFWMVATLTGVIALAAAAAVEPPYDWSTADFDATYGAGYKADFAQSRAICAKVIGLKAPVADQPTAQQRASLKGCSSEDLYYGTGMAKDPVKARLCAFTESNDSYFAGTQTLMMIYANGDGVKRNLPLATHYACGIEGAPAEMTGRIDHLRSLDPEDRFDLCDDITSGLMMGWCARRDADIDDARRNARIETIAKARGFASASDWTMLKKKLDIYASAHGDGEQDLSGTARGMVVTAAEQAQYDAFADALTKLAAGSVPPATAAQAAAADTRLNAAWKKVMAETPADGNGIGAPTRAGMREAGRAWIAYRDSFLAFPATQFPGTPRAALLRLLTDQRTDAINGQNVNFEG